MLRESLVSQKEESTYRRWFQDEYFDLIVWHDRESGQITDFQLCYDKNKDEHAFTWHATGGFSHHRIDNSRSPHRHPSTPILVDDGVFPLTSIMEKFRDSSGALEAGLRDLVMEKLSEFSKM